MKTLILLTLWLLIAVTYGQAPVFLVQPVSINTIEGREVVFTCTASGSSFLNFFVDDDPATDASVMNKGFMVASETLDGGLRRTNLTVTASSSHNNTIIKCTAFGSPTIDSDEVILRVQGPLSTVVDLSYSFINSSTVTISWSPPFTLPGTDITGYNISATSNGTTTNYFTSNSYYQLVFTSSCVKVNVTVSGYNGLEGEISSLIVNPSPMLSISVDVSITDNLKLIVSTNFTDVCNNNDATSSTITLTSDDLVQPLTVYVLFGTDILNYTADFILDEDTNYNVTVSYSIYDGDYIVTGSTSIDTYGVESLSYTNTTNGAVNFICYFNSFSTDKNCTVQLVQNGTVQYTATFNRTGDIAQGTISGIVTGVYDILAYDGGSNVVAASLENASVVVEGPNIPPQPSSIIHISSYDTISSTSAVVNIVSSSMPRPSNHEPDGEGPKAAAITNEDIIIIVVVVAFVLFSVMLTILIPMVIYCCCIKSRNCIDVQVDNKSEIGSGNKSQKVESPTPHDDVLVNNNPAYSSTVMGISTETNPAYEQRTAKKYYENITTF